MKVAPKATNESLSENETDSDNPYKENKGKSNNLAFVA